MLLMVAVVVSAAASSLPCADTNSKSFHSITMKLHNSVYRHTRKIKFDWRHYRILYARVMPLFYRMLPYGDTSDSRSSSCLKMVEFGQ